MRLLLVVLFVVNAALGFSQSSITYTKVRNNLAVIVGSDTLKFYKSGSTFYISSDNLVLNSVDSVKFKDNTSIMSATDSTYIKFTNIGWSEGWLTIGQDTLRIDTTGSVTPTGYVSKLGDTISGVLKINNDLVLTDSVIHSGLITYSYTEIAAAGTLFTAPTGIEGIGEFSDIGSSNYAKFLFQADGTVTLLESTANVKNTDTGIGNDICIYDGGAGFIIKYYSGIDIIQYFLTIKFYR